MLQTVRAAGAEAVRKGPSLLGKGRPFPRSSPGSVLLSKSQRTTVTGSRAPPALPSTCQQQSLRLSPTKQSPGSLSESSPSPTSVPYANKSQNAHSTATAITSSTSSGALTLTPSTTSSSLTSVTTPNSLTPVSSTAKSITPVATTFNSNYSLTSEMSTTSVVMSPSPTPGKVELSESYASPDDIFATVSVRSRVTAFQGQELPPNGNAVPPSPFPGRKFSGPGHAERSHSMEEREKRRLPALPQQHSLPQQQYSVIGNGNSSGGSSGGSIPGSGMTSYIPSSIGAQYYSDPENNLRQSTGVKQSFPPPPPPKPGSVQRERDLREARPRDSDLTEVCDSGPLNGTSSPSWMTPTHGPENGRATQQEVLGQKPPTTSSPVTTSGVTPAPPPVPPRLDRRPSQPSPTSSPPSMPPPVPPRLGRAAPVRTPPLDSREAFDVDCYTIKEENGEEDFLT